MRRLWKKRDLVTEEKETQLALNSSSVEGFNSLKTMKFAEKFKERPVVILLDSGVTRNFISKKIVMELNLPISAAKFAVTLGDERKVRGMGKCNQVELRFQGISMIQEFFFFYLGNVDVILGVHCLYKLGEIKINWKR